MAMGGGGGGGGGRLSVKIAQGSVVGGYGTRLGGMHVWLDVRRLLQADMDADTLGPDAMRSAGCGRRRQRAFAALAPHWELWSSGSLAARGAEEGGRRGGMQPGRARDTS